MPRNESVFANELTDCEEAQDGIPSAYLSKTKQLQSSVTLILLIPTAGGSAFGLNYRNAYRSSAGKSERQRTSGRPGRRRRMQLTT